MAITIRDVAARAQVSIATASRALRDHPSVSDATKARVIEAAAAVGYAPVSRTPGAQVGRVAVITPFVGRWFFGHVIEGIERVLRDRALDMVVMRVGPGLQRIVPPDLHTRGIVGVIILNLDVDMDQIRPLQERGIPVAALGINHPAMPTVRIDDTLAAREATRHLVSLGHRRIGLVSGQQYDTAPFRIPRERREGVLMELQRHGIAWDPSLEVFGNFTTHGAMRAVEALLDRPDRPSAIIAESDEMAFGVMAAAARRGLWVPHDLSVIGFDDHESSGAWDLTTVAQPVESQGELVAWQIIAALGDGSRTPQSVVMPTTLIERGSTARFAPGGSEALKE